MRQAVVRFAVIGSLMLGSSAAQSQIAPPSDVQETFLLDVYGESAVAEHASVGRAGDFVQIHAYSSIRGTAYIAVSSSIHWSMLNLNDLMILPPIELLPGHILMTSILPKELGGLAFVVQAALLADDGEVLLGAPNTLMIIPSDYDLDVVMPAVFGFVDAPQRSFPL